MLGKEFFFTADCGFCSYHIFKSFREARVGSVVIPKHEVDPQSLMHDKFAITLVNSDLVTIGYIPKFMSNLTYIFLKHGAHIKCEITGVKKYLNNLE